MSAIPPIPFFVRAQEILSTVDSKNGIEKIDETIKSIFQLTGRHDKKGKEEALEAINEGLRVAKLGYFEKIELALYAEAKIKEVTSRTVFLRDGSIELNPKQILFLVKNAPSFQGIPLEGTKEIASPFSLEELTYMIGDLTDPRRAIHPFDLAKSTFSFLEGRGAVDEFLTQLEKSPFEKDRDLVYRAIKEGIKGTDTSPRKREWLALYGEAKFLKIDSREVRFLKGAVGKISPQRQLFLIKNSPYFAKLWGASSEKPSSAVLPMKEDDFLSMFSSVFRPGHLYPRLKGIAPLENLIIKDFIHRLKKKSLTAEEEMAFFHTVITSNSEEGKEIVAQYIQEFVSACKLSTEFEVVVNKYGQFIETLKLPDDADNTWLPFLQHLPNLISLELKEDITNLSPLSTLTSLSILTIYGSGAAIDPTPLSSLKKLTYLEIFSCPITDFTWLSDLKELRSLDLSYCKIGAEGAEKLAKLSLPKLKTLYLEYNKIGDLGVQKLALSPLLRGLTFLNLGHNQIGNGGARLLSQAYLVSLTTLSLRGNPIGFEGIRAILDSPHLPQLEYFGVVDAELPQEEPEADMRETLYKIAGLKAIELTL